MKSIVRCLVSSAAVLSSVCAWAEEDEKTDEAEKPSAEDAEVVVPKKAANETVFHLLPLCRLVEGTAEIRMSGSQEWKPVEEGRFYPLGSSYRTVGSGSRLVIMMGRESEIILSDDASASTRPQPIAMPSRAIDLLSGEVTVKLPSNMKPGLFTVATPGFAVENLAGESRYRYSVDADGSAASVRCVTGSIAMNGRHFAIPAMHAADELEIRTSQDRLFTALYGKSGDFAVRLDQGVAQIKDFETGETKTENKTLVWKLSPLTAVRIHRALPAVGSRMSVTVMTFDASGELVNRCAFAEGRYEINSGELGPSAEKEKGDLAKKAAEATESEKVVADEDGDKKDDVKEEKSDNDDSSEAKSEDKADEDE